MLKAKWLPQYPLPYSLLIYRICEYKGVNTSDEQFHRTTNTNKISQNLLKQMKFIPLGDTYDHKDEMLQYDNEEEENPPTIMSLSLPQILAPLVGLMTYPLL